MENTITGNGRIDTSSWWENTEKPADIDRFDPIPGGTIDPADFIPLTYNPYKYTEIYENGEVKTVIREPMPPPAPEPELTPWLAEAAKITTGDRRRDYGRPLLNFLRIAIRWSNLLGVDITPDKVALMMLDMKIAREQHTPKEDNWVDILGYSACASDMDQQMREMGYEDGIRTFSDMTVSGMQLLYERVLREHLRNMPLAASTTNAFDKMADREFHEWMSNHLNQPMSSRYG